MKQRCLQTKGQMKLSFGMIFSIILIIIFISFAFYAIQKFLGLQKTIQIKQFIDNFQSDIDKMWSGSQGSQKVEYFLPSKIGYVCFADFSSSGKGQKKNIYLELEKVYYEYENLIFYPVGSARGEDAKEIKHIDIEKTTEKENPFCVQNIKGKVKMVVEKDYGEALVTITRINGNSIDINKGSNDMSNTSPDCSNCLSLSSSEKADCCLDKNKCCP